MRAPGQAVTTAPPHVTIGMPVYNGERFIREAIDSLLAQSFRDFELLISDNASTDATPDICQAYAARDSRVRYVRQPHNVGLFGNVEFVMRNGRAAYFMVCGDDDVYREDYLERLLPILEADPSVGLVYSDFGYVREDGSTLPTGRTSLLDRRASRFRAVLTLLFKRPALPMMMGVFRVEEVRRPLPFASLGPRIGGEDLLFLTTVLTHTRAVGVAGVLFHYRLKDRAGVVPPGFPSTAVRRWFFLLNTNLRLTAAMCRRILASDLGVAARWSLVVAAYAAIAFHVAVAPLVERMRRRGRARASHPS